MESTTGADNDIVIQWFANPVSRKWTELRMPTQSIACIWSAGGNFGSPPFLIIPKPKGTLIKETTP